MTLNEAGKFIHVESHTGVVTASIVLPQFMALLALNIVSDAPGV